MAPDMANCPDVMSGLFFVREFDIEKSREQRGRGSVKKKGPRITRIARIEGQKGKRAWKRENVEKTGSRVKPGMTWERGSVEPRRVRQTIAAGASAPRTRRTLRTVNPEIQWSPGGRDIT